jgi:hypothetical protein
VNFTPRGELGPLGNRLLGFKRDLRSSSSLQVQLSEKVIKHGANVKIFSTYFRPNIGGKNGSFVKYAASCLAKVISTLFFFKKKRQFVAENR